MHCLYFFVYSKRNGDTCKDAECFAASVLNHEKFAGSPGFFAHPKCEWFVVGGEFSHTFRNQNAVVINHEIYNILQSEDYKYIEVFDYDDFDEYVVCDMEKDQLLGRWLVVVDYFIK